MCITHHRLPRTVLERTEEQVSQILKIRNCVKKRHFRIWRRHYNSLVVIIIATSKNFKDQYDKHPSEASLMIYNRNMDRNAAILSAFQAAIEENRKPH